MISQENRLKKRKDFKIVFKKGKAIIGRAVFLKIIKTNLNISRFGFAIGLKASKKAFIRNRIKRWLREIIRKNIPNIKSGFDVVIIAKPEIINKKYQEIKEEIEKLLEKAKLHN